MTSDEIEQEADVFWNDITDIVYIGHMFYIMYIIKITLNTYDSVNVRAYFNSLFLFVIIPTRTKSTLQKE